MENFGKFVSEHHWGDIASVFGVIISVVGFAATIWNVVRSKSVAETARDAAVRARDAVMRINVLTELSEAIAIMEEIKRLHRIPESWPLLPDRYTSVNKKLRAARNSRPSLSQEKLDVLQEAMQQFREMEKKVEHGPGKKAGPSARLNDIVSQQIEKVDEILSGVRTGMEMGTYDKR